MKVVVSDSMGLKVAAAIQFVGLPGTRAAIGSLQDTEEMVAGTIVHPNRMYAEFFSITDD